MGLFDKFFRKSAEKEFENRMKVIEKGVEAAYSPCKKILEEIVKASYDCANLLKENLAIEDDQEKQLSHSKTFYEFLYFYTHITLRWSSSIMEEGQFRKMHAFIGPVIVDTATDTFFAHWPADKKAEIKAGIYEDLNETNIKYSSATELGGQLQEGSIIDIFVKRVADVNGRPMDKAIMSRVYCMAITTLDEMKLNDLVADAAKVL
jgi:hypothetical protein